MQRSSKASGDMKYRRSNGSGESTMARTVADFVVDDLVGLLRSIFRDEIAALLREQEQRLLKHPSKGVSSESRKSVIKKQISAQDLEDDGDHPQVVREPSCGSRSWNSGCPGRDQGPSPPTSDRSPKVSGETGVTFQMDGVQFARMQSGPAIPVEDKKSSLSPCHRRRSNSVLDGLNVLPTGSSPLPSPPTKGGVSSWLRGSSSSKGNSSVSTEKPAPWNTWMRLRGTEPQAAAPSVKDLEEWNASEVLGAWMQTGGTDSSAAPQQGGQNPFGSARKASKSAACMGEVGVQQRGMQGSQPHVLTHSKTTPQPRPESRVANGSSGKLIVPSASAPNLATRQRRKSREEISAMLQNRKPLLELAPSDKADRSTPRQTPDSHVDEPPDIPQQMPILEEPRASADSGITKLGPIPFHDPHKPSSTRRSNNVSTSASASPETDQECESEPNGPSSCSISKCINKSPLASSCDCKSPTELSSQKPHKLSQTSAPPGLRRSKSEERSSNGSCEQAQMAVQSEGLHKRVPLGVNRRDRRAKTSFVEPGKVERLSTSSDTVVLASVIGAARRSAHAHTTSEVRSRRRSLIRSPAKDNARNPSADSGSEIWQSQASHAGSDIRGLPTRKEDAFPGGNCTPDADQDQSASGDEDECEYDEEEEEEYFESDELTSSDTNVSGNSPWPAKPAVSTPESSADSPEGGTFDAPLWLRMCGMQAVGHETTFWRAYRRLIVVLGIFCLVVSTYDAIEVQSSLDTASYPAQDGVARTGVQFRQLSDIVMSLGSFVALLTLWKYATNGLLGNSEAVLASYARRQGVMEKWSNTSTARGCGFVLLWLFAVVSRFVALSQIAFEAAPGSISRKSLDYLRPAAVLMAFIISSSFFMLIAHAMLHVTSALTIMIDAYCYRFVEMPNLEMSVREWNMLQGLLRKASCALEWSFLVFQTTAMLSLMLTMGSLYLRGTSDVWYLFSILPLSIADGRLFFKAAEITEKCTRVPALINSLTFGLDVDRNRHYLVEYVTYSNAGFYVGEVRLTQAMALKLTYISGLLAFGVFTKVSSEN